MKKQAKIGDKMVDIEKVDDYVAYDKEGNVFEVFRTATA